MKTQSLSRRKFLKHAAGAVALPFFVPASALGRDGTVAPSNRIVMAGIGLGGRGQGVLRTWDLPDKEVQFVAVCDVWNARREQVKAIVDAHYGNKDCATYIDMHELLARKDIDVIHTATGDRWHAGVSIAAICSPRSISPFSSSASLFSRTVANRTNAEITISTEATMKGSSIVQMLRSAAGALM